MTLPTSGPISVSDINTELGLSPTYSSSLNFLNGFIKTPPASPNLDSFHGLSYYQRNADGNCNNANCTASGGPNGNCSSNCNCGNIADTNCFISGPSDCAVCANCSAINCANCDTQPWLQTGSNCACSYNCNCNAAVSYNCSVCSGGSHNCNCDCNCSKIVCGKLYDYGLMSKTIWSADQAYGRLLRKTDKDMYRGYFRWARPVTQWMDGQGPDFMLWIPKERRARAQQDLMIELTHRVGTPWSEHMAYTMGTLSNDNQQGRILMKIGRFFCRAVNSIPKMPTKYKKSPWVMPYSLLSSYTIWFLLELSYYTSIVCIKTLELSNANKKEVKEY